MSDAAAIPSQPVHGRSQAQVVHKVNYFAVFGILVILTFLTVVVAYFNLRSETAKILLALSIASLKASAVILYFMHMKFEGKLIYLILLVPLTLSILLVLSLLPDITFAPMFHEVTTRVWRLIQG